MSSQDESVMSTNDDAANCKRYAVQLGYYEDPFLAHLVKTGPRKAPEISRGYYARVWAVRHLIDKFIAANQQQECQIVNLGAGFDTLYWRLRRDGVRVQSYIEIDLPQVASRKVHYIRQRKQLLNALVNEDEDIRFSSSDLHAGAYHLLGCDLRHLEVVESKIKDHLNFDLPTCFVAECVLVYMEVAHSQQLLKWIAEKFAKPVFINYEQVNMSDRFGEIMIENLKKRCCSLEGVAACKTLRTQEERFLLCNWPVASSLDMCQVYNLIPRCERDRVEKIEFLDEVELLQQLLQHYCVTIATKQELKISF